jgi:hypothetical protein
MNGQGRWPEDVRPTVPEYPHVTADQQLSEAIAVYFEQGKRRVFACSLDWPGWCRRDKSEDLALKQLAAYGPRYAAVTGLAGLDFPAAAVPGAAAVKFTVTERLDSPFGADFGAPMEIPDSDREPVDAAAAQRTAALVGAAWEVFDQVAAAAPAQLRKGPRGGGRDRGKIVDHVIGADFAYARKLGVRHRQAPASDRAAIEAMRAGVLGVLGSPSDGGRLAAKGWPARYAARRIAWHALDHAWEIEDRTDPGAHGRHG